jgi:hypothetical protein
MKPRVLAYLMLIGQYERMDASNGGRALEVIEALDKLWWKLDDLEQTAFANDRETFEA